MERDHGNKICIVEPFYTGSHAYWADGLSRNMQTEVGLVTLSGEGWRKAMSKSAPLLALKVANLGFEPKLILLSSMTNAHDFRQALPQGLSNTPLILYMHENQFGYPGSKSGNKFAEINWISMNSANHVLVNSEYHRSELASKLIESYGLQAAEAVLTKTSVLPIGVNAHSNSKRDIQTKPLILFNHRWEFDKQPEVALDALCQVSKATNEGFELALCGEHYPGLTGFGTMEKVLRASIKYEGFLDEETYAQCLSESDIVISTSKHEYFGISVAEAVLAGAIPVLPNDLNYPALVPESHHKHCLYEPSQNPETMANNCANKLITVLKTWENLDTRPLISQVSQYRWPQVGARYDQFVTEFMNSLTT